MLSPKLKNYFPGFTWALGAVVVISVVEQFMPAGGEHHAPGAPAHSAAKKTGDGGHGVH